MLAFVILSETDCKSAQTIHIEVRQPESDFADNVDCDERDSNRTGN